MSKRLQLMKEFGRSMKKPKLDISISSRITSCSTTQSIPTKDNIMRNESPIRSSTNGFWDDDDDDVILLATQVAEAAAAAEKDLIQTKQQEKECVNITESEITFSEFANAATTSTQQQIIKNIPGPDILSQMFQDDDDDFELLVAAQVSDPDVFKKPVLPPSTSTGKRTQQQKNRATEYVPMIREASEDLVEFVLSQNTGPESTLPSSQSSARRQLASERQIKFLIEKVDFLKKENSKLSKEMAETKSKVASKEGEASLLRDELRHLKQQAQNLKMEKILSAQNVQNECQSKMDELAKTIQAKEAEVRMKEMECSLVKMRYEEDTQRLQQSFRDESIINKHIKERRKEDQSEKSSAISQHRRLTKCLMRMPSLDVCDTFLTQFDECSLNKVHHLIYEHSVEKGSSKKRRPLFQVELKNIQTKVAQLQLLGVEKLTNSFVKDCIESVSRVLTEFWSYIHSLEFPKNRRIYPYKDCFLTNSKFLSRRNDISCLQQPLELYDDERCLCLRRYLAALSIICQQVTVLSSSLMEHRSGDYYLLEIVTDSVIKLGYAREIWDHFGVLEALAVWLNSLLLNVKLSTPVRILEMLVELLKSLVFARPNAWVFKEISFGLKRISGFPVVLEMVCVNSPESSFVADRVKSTYGFSNESCLMQVYCGLLEIAFPLSRRLHVQHFELLVVICANHVRFVYQCFQKPPKFIKNRLPLYDDEDDDFSNERSDDDTKEKKTNFKTTESSTSISNTSPQATRTRSDKRVKDESPNLRCECYVKLCLSIVTVIFQLLRQWLLHKREHCTLQVAEISKLSVQLFHTIFCDNYLTCLFRDSEETTKHHLSLIVKWWSENFKQLQLNAIHMKLLDKLQNSHVLPNDITVDTNFHNIKIDVGEWQKYTNDNTEKLKLPTNSEEAEGCANKLNLIQDASQKSKFFENLKGFAFNFQ